MLDALTEGLEAASSEEVVRFGLEHLGDFAGAGRRSLYVPQDSGAEPAPRELRLAGSFVTEPRGSNEPAETEFPFRTVCMLLGLITALVVSRLTGIYDEPRPLENLSKRSA